MIDIRNHGIKSSFDNLIAEIVSSKYAAPAHDTIMLESIISNTYIVMSIIGINLLSFILLIVTEHKNTKKKVIFNKKSAIKFNINKK